ncbi:MAG: tRNA (adenosine(37)-N6)-threonylcarbamoyltransferase complex ATPase subunit type 1 TsaE [Candidatus Eisenbacteria bacterium]|nr:tRNA (adenosine(37)-N6)-threonylcarbamoyltransferase complex ATPase subunit type 1 TsaE [Candidatus Eisenbacteria bacterium]
MRREGDVPHQGAGEVQTPGRRRQQAVRDRQGGLLLRLPDGVPPLRAAVQGQLPARRHLARGDDPAVRRHGAEIVTGPPAEEGALRFRTTSPDETRELGRRVGQRVEPGAFIGLIGDLGSGKTVFVQGLALGLECDEPVSSPTFVIINEYSGRLPVHHVDLYRLTDEAAVESLGYRELFWSDGVTVVEWAERAGALVPDDRLDIRLGHVSESVRSFDVRATGPSSSALLSLLEAAVGGEDT